MLLSPPTSTLFPYTTLFRSEPADAADEQQDHERDQQEDNRDRRSCGPVAGVHLGRSCVGRGCPPADRSEEHTSELQSLRHLVCRLLLEKTTTKEHEMRHSST